MRLLGIRRAAPVRRGSECCDSELRCGAWHRSAAEARPSAFFARRENGCVKVAEVGFAAEGSSASGGGFPRLGFSRFFLGFLCLLLFERCERVVLPADRLRKALRCRVEVLSKAAKLLRERRNALRDFINFGFGLPDVGFSLNVLGMDGNGGCGRRLAFLRFPFVGVFKNSPQ